MKYFLGGVNGSGKTTLLAKIKQLRPKFEVIKGSQALMSFLGMDGDYEKLRAFPHEEGLVKLGQMMEQILAQPNDVIVDSHYMNLVRGKTKKVTGPWIKRFDAAILLKVSAKTAIGRTAKDLRDRALFPEDAAGHQTQDMYQGYISQYEGEFGKLVEDYGLRALVLDGEQSPEKIAQEFINFHDKLP